LRVAALVRYIGAKDVSVFKKRGHTACHIALEVGKKAVLSEYLPNLAHKNEKENENYLEGKFVGKNE
jgi:hypothetical protein